MSAGQDQQSEKGKLVTEELAESVLGNDPTRTNWTGINGLVPDEDPILTGVLHGDWRAYEQAALDDQVKSVFQQRRLGVVSREWEVVAGGEDAASEQAADELREMLKRINFDAITEKMLWGVFYGYAVGEVLWEVDGGRIDIAGIKVRKPWRFREDLDGNLRKLTLDNLQGEIMPPRKFWTFCAGADNDDEPYGRGLAYWLYWPVFFKRNGVNYWAIYLDRFGSPTPVGTFPAGATQPQKDALKLALSAIRTTGMTALPEGTTVELLESTRSGTADYKGFVNEWNDAIAKVILSQTMTTEDGSSRSQGEVHERVAGYVLKSDADLVCASFNEGPVKWWTEYNFPGAEPPQVWRRFEEEEDLNDVTQNWKNVSEATGLRPTQDTVEETMGGEWEEKPGVGEPPTDFSEGAKRGKCACTEFAEGAEDVIDEAVAEGVENWEEVLDPLVGEAVRRIGEAASFEEVAELLEELADENGLDDSELREALAGANLVGRGVGDTDTEEASVRLNEETAGAFREHPCPIISGGDHCRDCPKCDFPDA